jgi:RNA polymerase sigma factor for flagellar operon FliA
MMRLVKNATTPVTEAAKATEDRLVREHLNLVRRAVAEISAKMPKHAPRDDLMSAGMCGLAQAARSYDPSRGVPFHAYAATRIRGSLLDELRAYDWASRPVRARARQLELANEKITAKLGRPATTSELAAEMDVTVTSVQGLQQDLHRATVLNYDSMVSNGDGESIIAGNEDEDPERSILDRERNAYLVDAIRALPERLRTVVIGYFFENRPMQDIGNELGVSESRISQLRAEALELLRDGINSQLDPDALTEFVNPTGRVARRRNAYYTAIADGSSCRDRVDSKPRFQDA